MLSRSRAICKHNIPKAMNKQASKENDKQMMCVPKHFEIRTSVKNGEVIRDRGTKNLDANITFCKYFTLKVLLMM